MHENIVLAIINVSQLCISVTCNVIRLVNVQKDGDIHQPIKWPRLRMEQESHPPFRKKMQHSYN
jgi:hypothetical protein